MPGPLAKKTAKRKTSAKSETMPVGRILEMRLARQHRRSPLMLVLLLIAVAGITTAVLSFKRMSEALEYAGSANEELAASRSRVAGLQEKVTDLQTLQTLASKKVEPPAVVPDQSWKAYASKNITLRYPADFSFVPASAAFPALTLKGGNGRIEIFRMKDFGGKREVGPGDEIPKESLLVGTALEDSRIQPYDAWLYYAAGDETTRDILQAIAATVTALK